MKKLKFLGTAILAASLIFAGCSSQADDETVDPVPVEKPADNKGNQTPVNNGEENKDDNKDDSKDSEKGEDQKTPEDNKESEKPEDNKESEKPEDNKESEETETPVEGEKPVDGEKPSDNEGEEQKTPEETKPSDDDNKEDPVEGEKEENDYVAPAIDDYFKYYIVGSTDKNTTKDISGWGDGSVATKNADGTWSIAASDAMWGGISGICAAFTKFENGYLSNYEYIVFTVDTTDFVINAGDGTGNYGVNVKVPEIQKNIISNYVADGKVRTYYAPISIFEAAPTTANEFAIIIGGEGTLKLNELYLAAAEDPTAKPVTSITAVASDSSILAGDKVAITVTDSNHMDRTADATFTIAAGDTTGSSIAGNVVTAGTTGGDVTVNVTLGDVSTQVTITVITSKDYAKYWNLDTTGTGQDAAPADYFSIWADKWWCGSNVTLSDMAASETGVTLKQTVEGSNWFGTQIWYGVTAKSNLSFKVTASVDGDITINKVVYTLEADTAKEISLEGVDGKLAIQLGTENPNTQIGDCTFTISDFSVTPVTE